MATGQIHYEVYQKMSAKVGWTLVEAFENRAKALEHAQNLINDSPSSAVKVSKETFKASEGDFLTITIFEQGFKREADAKPKAKEAELPCFKPQDLYTLHARHTIARVLSGPLSRWGITVSELMHSAAAVERLEVSGMDLQHAVQKVAVPHASDNAQPVQEVIKKLNELVGKTIEKVYADEKSGCFPELGDKGLAGAFKKVQKKSDPAYGLRGAIAKRLADVKTWAEKLSIVLGLIDSAPTEETERALCLDAVDAFVSEMIEGRAALSDLIGAQQDHGAAITLLIEVFLGRTQDIKEAPKGVLLLAETFSADALPHSRRALAKRILHELKEGPRLLPDDIEGEVKLVRKLAGRIVMGQGPYLEANEITEAFARRSRRLVTPESIAEFLSDVADPEAQLHKLFDIEENIVGAENRRMLANQLIALLSMQKTENYFSRLPDPPIARLQKLAYVQRRAFKSHFAETDKIAMAKAVDDIALRVDDETGFLKRIEKQNIAITDKVIALLRLCVRDILTKGESEMRAKRLAAKMMREPAFLKAVADHGGDPDRQKAMLAELKSLLTETGLNTMGGTAKASAAAG